MLLLQEPHHRWRVLTCSCRSVRQSSAASLHGMNVWTCRSRASLSNQTLADEIHALGERTRAASRRAPPDMQSAARCRHLHTLTQTVRLPSQSKRNDKWNNLVRRNPSVVLLKSQICNVVSFRVRLANRSSATAAASARETPRCVMALMSWQALTLEARRSTL